MTISSRNQNLHRSIAGRIKSASFHFSLAEGDEEKSERGREGGEKSVRVAIRAAKNSLRNKQAAWTSVPCRPIHHADLQRGQEEEGKGRREGRRGRAGGGGAALLSSVYKPDRWSGALTRTIKQKTTGCFLLCFFFFFPFLLNRNPTAAAARQQRRQQQLRGSLSRARQSEKVATKSRGRADK